MEHSWLRPPVWKMLKSKQIDEESNPACRGALQSALAGRQYPQARSLAAGSSEHNRCILCLHDIVQADLAKNGAIPAALYECSNGMQARAWCSHEGGNTTRSGNSSDLLSCGGLDRSLFASATGACPGLSRRRKSKLWLPRPTRLAGP